MQPNEGTVFPNIGIASFGSDVSHVQPMQSGWTTVNAGDPLAVAGAQQIGAVALSPSLPSPSEIISQLKDQVFNELIDESIKNARIRSSQEDAYLKLHAHLRDLGFDVEPTATETVISLAVALIQGNHASILKSVSDDKLIREIFRRYPCDVVSNVPDIELKVHSLDTFQEIPTLTPTVDIRVKVPRT